MATQNSTGPSVRKREYHGQSSGAHTPEYRAWTHLKDRCCNPKDRKYHLYGGRGIRICERWFRSFLAFFEDMGVRPSPKHSIDRIDNDGSYTCGKCEDCKTHGAPANCRWATDKQQCSNTRRIRLLACQGRTQPLQAWLQETGLSRKTVESRLARGWSVEQALTTPMKTVANGLLRENLRGRVFGQLTAIEYAGTEDKRTLWKCRCMCGKEVIVDAGHLKGGHTRSCGCFKLEVLKATRACRSL